ncbi:MAG: diaminopimelate dehydrogenase [Oscillospiraceae bacterium]|nr:diaminopimelate dehydrogenase [Oscillospiraceae bacterium]
MSQGLIRVGIVGYGNIGKGVEKAVVAARDMELSAIFTRRDPALLKPKHSEAQILSIREAEKMVGKIDALALCGSSAADLMTQGPQFAALFNTVDCFDTHAKIPGYLAAVDAVAKNTTAIVSSGWDPGLFSMIRAFSEAVLPDGASYTFWGRGVSQGHSDAIRQIEGVRDAVQYTVPIESAIEAARSSERPELGARQRHLRECYVVTNPGADTEEIESKIKSMPDYFADYDTSVTFIDHDEFVAKHSKMPHGGMVLRSGATGENSQAIEFSLRLGSNPEFTGSVMAAYARAAFRMASEGNFGAKTVFDIPLAYLSEKDRGALIKELL